MNKIARAIGATLLLSATAATAQEAMLVPAPAAPARLAPAPAATGTMLR